MCIWCLREIDGSVVRSPRCSYRILEHHSQYIRWLTGSCNSHSRACSALFWTLWVPAFMCTYPYTDIRLKIKSQKNVYWVESEVELCIFTLFVTNLWLWKQKRSQPQPLIFLRWFCFCFGHHCIWVEQRGTLLTLWSGQAQIQKDLGFANKQVCKLAKSQWSPARVTFVVNVTLPSPASSAPQSRFIAFWYLHFLQV